MQVDAREQLALCGVRRTDDFDIVGEVVVRHVRIRAIGLDGLVFVEAQHRDSCGAFVLKARYYPHRAIVSPTHSSELRDDIALSVARTEQRRRICGALGLGLYLINPPSCREAELNLGAGSCSAAELGGRWHRRLLRWA